MSEFKFSCHSCGQKMKAASPNVGMQIECPVCKTQIIIPAAPKNPEDVPVSTKPVDKPKATRSEAEEATKATDRKAADGRMKPKGKSLVAKESMAADPQVGSLTGEIKLDIMLAVRERLADEKHWLPKRNEQKKFNYAAKKEDGKLVSVPVESKEATHFSLVGAILLEFHKRNVIRTASGRNRFLDIEVIEAILEVGLNKPYVPEYQGARPKKGADDDVALDHKQTLKAIDLLIKRYEMEAKGISFHATSDSAKHVRVADLIRKLEKEEEITAEDIVKAFQFEMKFMDKRISDLERHAGRG